MTSRSESSVSIFMCGDVMTGRGIDQILPHPVHPALHEYFVTDARRYVEIAERVNGPIARRVGSGYIWGDAIEVLSQLKPDVRLINLETSITTCGDFWRGKGINYRMNPSNVAAIASAGIDVCALANNHVLDWGYPGLEETLLTLERAGIGYAGAGRSLEQAAAPATVDVPGKGRVLVFSFCDVSSGIPSEWAAKEKRAGVNLLPDVSEATAEVVGDRVTRVKKPGDLAIASIHWGSNWDFDVPHEQRRFAHRLIDQAGVDVVHGHSSHHVKGIEVYRGKLILYGCGDFLNDYEGIRGYEEYRGDLGLMYFARVDASSGGLEELRLVPTRVRKFRISVASAEDGKWISDTLNREGRRFGTAVSLQQDGSLLLLWE